MPVVFFWKKNSLELIKQSGNLVQFTFFNTISMKLSLLGLQEEQSVMLINYPR